MSHVNPPKPLQVYSFRVRLGLVLTFGPTKDKRRPDIYASKLGMPRGANLKVESLEEMMEIAARYEEIIEEEESDFKAMPHTFVLTGFAVSNNEHEHVDKMIGRKVHMVINDLFRQLIKQFGGRRGGVTQQWTFGKSARWPRIVPKRLGVYFLTGRKVATRSQKSGMHGRKRRGRRS